jgi:hypothetical protein
VDFTLKEGPTSADVALDGDITDNVGPALKKLAKALTQPTIRFNCERVRRISSVGCLRWQQFLLDLGAPRRLEYIRCSVSFTAAALMVPSLLGERGRLLTFHAPYTCRSCRASHEPLIEVDALKRSHRFPPLTCGKCAEAMEPDLDVEQVELLP